jgi:NAD(P)-dependent dehydrogenase (short-subunit alcohol dehydrogenase family)
MTDTAADTGAPSARPALVTGASRGIGRAAALALSAAGHPVAACSRGESELERTAELAREVGGALIAAVPFDAGDLEACAELRARAAGALGADPLIFVHCAGISRPRRFERISLEVWEQTMRVNVTSALVLAQACIPVMRERGWGRIVTIGSLTSRVGMAFTGSYATSKHALLGLTRVMSAELARDGVTANCILPGWVDTEMLREESARVAEARGVARDDVVTQFMRNQPMQRLITPGEIGALVGYLCSDAAAPITGQAINVDGGEVQS